MVTGAEPEQRRRLVPQMRKHELALGPVGQRHGRAAHRIDQLGMDEAPGAEMHAALRFAFAPQRHTDVADAHRLADFGAPCRLEPRPHPRLASTRFARDQQPRHA